MTDRVRQALRLLALEPVSETIADPNSHGVELTVAPLILSNNVLKACAEAIKRNGFLRETSKPAWIKLAVSG